MFSTAWAKRDKNSLLPDILHIWDTFIWITTCCMPGWDNLTRFDVLLERLYQCMYYLKSWKVMGSSSSTEGPQSRIKPNMPPTHRYCTFEMFREGESFTGILFLALYQPWQILKFPRASLTSLKLCHPNRLVQVWGHETMYNMCMKCGNHWISYETILCLKLP